MQIRIQILSFLIGAVLLAIIFQLIRKNKLLEQYAILWIVSAVIVIVLAAWRGMLEKMSRLIGICYPPSALFAIAIFCGMVIALHFSVVISKLTNDKNKLTQEMALLKNQVEKLQEKIGE